MCNESYVVAYNRILFCQIHYYALVNYGFLDEFFTHLEDKTSQLYHGFRGKIVGLWKKDAGVRKLPMIL